MMMETKRLDQEVDLEFGVEFDTGQLLIESQAPYFDVNYIEAIEKRSELFGDAIETDEFNQYMFIWLAPFLGSIFFTTMESFYAKGYFEWMV